MASKRKRFVSAITQDELLQRFYDELDNEETDFLGNTFDDDDNANQLGYSESESDSDHNNDECEMEVDDDPLTGPDEEIHVAPMRKQNFANLENIIDADNFDPLPEQQYTEFEYSNASKSFCVQWETVRRNNKQNSGRLPQRNVLQNKTGSRNEARNVTAPLTAFSLFLPDDLLETVVTHTNNRI